MASTTIKSPPLSYAERARRAQNIKSKISAPPPQTSSPKSVTLVPSPSVVSTTNASANSIHPSSGSDDANAPSLTSNPSSVVTSTAPTAVATSESKAPIASATSAQTQLAVQALSIVAAHTTSTPPAKPVQNVWSLRAAARATAPHHISKTTPSASQSSGGDAAKSLSDVSSNSGPRLTMTNIPSSVSLNGSSALSSFPSDNHLPNGQTPSQPIPDPENWPQVGVKLGATNELLPPLPLPETRPNGSAAPSSASPRKGEKTKWVAIPAAELQAAADALKPRTQPSRKQQPRSGANNTAASNARNPSGRTSASHSRTQSRTASTSSSPRSGGRNAGRKLPSSNDTSQPSELASIPSTSAIPPNPSINTEKPPVSSLHFPPTHPNPQSIPGQPDHYQVSPAIFYPRGQQSPSTPSHHLGSPSTPLANIADSTSSSHISTASSVYPNLSIPPAPYGYAAPAGPLDFNPSSGINGSIPYAHQTSIWNGENPAFQRSHPVPNHEELVSLVMRQRPVTSSADNGVGETVATNGSAVPVLPLIDGSIPDASTGSSCVPTNREAMTFGSISLGEAKSPNTPAAVPGGDEAGGKLDRAFSESKEDSSLEKLANGKENTTPKLKGKEGRGKKGKVPPSTASIPPPAPHEQGGDNTTANGPSTEDSIEEVQPSTGTAGQQQSGAASRQMEVKYKFGTASNTPPVHAQRSLPSEEAPLASTVQVPSQADGIIHTSNTMPAEMSRLTVDDTTREATLSQRTAPFPLDPRGSVSFGHLPYPPQSYSHQHPHVHPTVASASIEPPMELGLEHGSPAPGSARPAVLDPDLTVKDYGFGFGNPRLQHELGVERQREISTWMETHNRHHVSPTGDEGAEHMWGPGQGAREVRGAGDASHGNWRGRRGGFGAAGASGSGPRGGGFGGGGYQVGGGGRRGRGGNIGANGFSRGYGRGRGGASINSQRAAERGPPPFTVTPPPHIQPLGPPSDGLYYGTRGLPAGYHPMSGMNGFDPYAPPLVPPVVPLTLPNPPLPHVSPPVPVPLSPISFPLDPTRYYLLGQLEYYLSPQNLASDFFLRTRMDSRGWIPIPLIASFNRVKQLTRDEVLVHDVLTLSSLVQVWGNMVRMGGWERYVLPDAAPSTVEEPLQQPTFFGQPVDGFDEQPYPTSSYEQQPVELGATNGLQLDLGDDKALEEEHTIVTESHAGALQNGTDVVAGEKSTGRLVNGHSHHNHYLPASEHEHDEDEDEEDDVVFVMGHEEGTWSSPERRS